jgi:predicted ATP-grasp superfamily ATP-dependent carboligase
MNQTARNGDRPDNRLLIVGASARAAAFSALRGGFRPICFDQFADADLVANGSATQIANYLPDLVVAIDGLDSIPAIYVGAVENEPELIQALERRGPLLGVPQETVTLARDPFERTGIFQSARLSVPDVRRAEDPPPPDGNWLIKPFRGASGREIKVWDSTAAPLDEPYYFQQRIEGDSHSAVFVAPQGRGDVRFVGMTRQLIGLAALNAPPFAWCGSVGPETLDVATEHLVRRIGNFCSWRLGLCGLFGCDFVVTSDGTPYLVDVNPRYTGSTEIFDHTLETSLIAEHCRTFEVVSDQTRVANPPHVPAMGKFILYADRDFQAPDPADWLLPSEQDFANVWCRTPTIADVPRAGTVIQRGQPVCSLFSVGPNRDACLSKLEPLVENVRGRLFS